jgi:hypothetical protein
MKRIWLWLFALLGMLGGCSSARAQEIDFCHFPVSKAILQAHSSFNAIYEMDVDSQGVPTSIRPVSKEFTKPEDVATCLDRWRLPDSAMKHLVVVFEWQHGIGWTRLALSGPGVNITVRLSGIRCPYHPASTNENDTSGSIPK